eukprot:CAMPEP_0206041402 /NCGR_PEP_ID=MMETSP1466-20131121/5951_1 /ASSEMBLY_ACC=CAM_ASM_001126 /TAXON_ID=44452 /ORGANISM="Pavlova gyrans, Strain CCMP608" /LENGTH=133 /DNA_ID=CAMNT_0053416099 /DNA_START=44 /DNA_END=445 /DNA_ORIENTATION=-
MYSSLRTIVLATLFAATSGMSSMAAHGFNVAKPKSPVPSKSAFAPPQEAAPTTPAAPAASASAGGGHVHQAGQSMAAHGFNLQKKASPIAPPEAFGAAAAPSTPAPQAAAAPPAPAKDEPIQPTKGTSYLDML